MLITSKSKRVKYLGLASSNNVEKLIKKIYKEGHSTKRRMNMIIFGHS